MRDDADAASPHQFQYRRFQRTVDGHPTFRTPLITIDEVGLMALSLHRVLGQRRPAQAQQPVDGIGRVVHCQANQFLIAGAVGNTIHIFEMQIGTVLDALRRLQRSASRAQLTTGAIQRATDPVGSLQHENLGAALGGENSCRQARRATPDDNQIPVLVRERLTRREG